jgi:2-polyprenyl-6-methoxyphenol hydroxylase-like FAD-dependent oxidoreductase
MRVAIVGGGAAGLSTALHLAPLVTQGYLCGPIDVYDTGSSDSSKGRDIGVGIWSTALDPFRTSSADSHQLVYQDMTRRGTFIRDVGYRTPSGQWLAESRLDGTIPDLLFLREKDMMAALRKAVHLEEQRGNISMQNGKVGSIYEESTEPWSSKLMIEKKDGADTTTRDYHLIVAADGMDSVLRKTYGGLANERQRLTGTSALPSPLDLPDNNHKTQSEVWGVAAGQEEATGTQDREYTVFRGNSPMSSKEPGLEKSFQTWGEGRSMRFATVPMTYPGSDGTREERQVWFITINDDSISSEPSPEKRKEKLLETFADWHDPIGQLVRSTPPQDILMERAMAHKHCLGPVGNFNGVISQIRRRNATSSGKGPALVFVGDAFMTVDPILAQGFSMGMEGAADLATALEAAVQEPQRPEFSQLSFDPYVLRKELKGRHDKRLKRLICLLRATELVQALGQPKCGTFLGWLSRDILRPLMRLTPIAIKTPIFNYMLKYSLGVAGSGSDDVDANKKD